MGWLYVPGLPGSTSPWPLSTARAIDVWVTLNGMPTRRRCSWHGWRTRPWIRLLSGMTSKPSTVATGVASWISSLRASRVNRSLPPANGAAPPTSGGSGLPLHESSKTFTPSTCFSKTCPVCSRDLPTDLVAYAAGLIDGEGCLLIASSTTNNRTRYWPMLRVGMTRSQALNVLWRTFGGTLNPRSRNATRPHEAAEIVWGLSGSTLACVLRVLIPHLHVKRQHAEIVLGMLSRPWPLSTNGRGIDWRADVSTQWEIAKRTLSDLNVTGRAMTSETFAVLVGNEFWTTQRSLFGEAWERFSGPWPSSGSLRNGICSERPRRARPNAANDSSSSENAWAAPIARDWKNGEASEATLTKNTRPLSEQAAHWPAPNTRDACSAGRHTTTTGVMHPGTMLTDAIRVWSTDSAPFLPDQKTPTDGDTCSPSVRTSRPRLNEAFVDWLMGWRPGWTACAPLAMESSHNKPRSHTPNSIGDCSGIET
jgi:hypothetical protein